MTELDEKEQIVGDLEGAADKARQRLERGGEKCAGKRRARGGGKPRRSTALPRLVHLSGIVSDAGSSSP